MEENKKNNVILSILCFVLVFACMLALLSVGEDSNFNTDEKDKTQNTNSSDSGEDTDSADSAETKPAIFYIDGDIGYRTIGNQTVFFLVCENPHWYENAFDFFYETWYLTVDPKDCVSYEGLTVDIRYSKDQGVTWGSLTKVADDSTEGEGTNIYALYNIQGSDTVYLSYCYISNCKDPVSVLSDLRENVFDDKYAQRYTGSGYRYDGNGDYAEIDYIYTIEYYQDFSVYRYNYKKPDVIIPSG